MKAASPIAANRAPRSANRFGVPARRIVAALIGAVLCLGPLAPRTTAQTDPSDVVLVLDFSASILEDVANRGRFAAALERIADRIDATASDLAAGDATVTLVQFATRAADYPGCVNLKLLGSLANVSTFAECVRTVAAAYRAGLSSTLTQKIGTDTNYVAAMERAAVHLPADAVRPALILFTDGKHDVPGVPVGQVQPALERLFGSRSPFALLPVGMGLDSTERAALESGLNNLLIIRDIPPCAGGGQFEWPQVVFESAAEAGNAVALALQNVTCTFTVAQTPPPSAAATPIPEPTPGAVRALSLTPGDGLIGVQWSAPATDTESIVAYRVRCRTGGGEWTEAAETPATSTATVVDGLTNGQEYECQVATVGLDGLGAWTSATLTATPVGPPSRPGKPSVEGLDHAIRLHPAEPVFEETDYQYECSADQGQTWSAKSLPAVGNAAADVTNLTNGVEYVCRAYASNASGLSEPSELSDAVRPCGTLIECRPIAVPLLGLVGAVALLGLLTAILGLYRSRTRGYAVAVVDVIHTANLGYGSKVGFRFVRDGPGGAVTGIEPARGRRAEVRIRSLGGGRFEVSDRRGRHVAASGEPTLTVDSAGVQHSMTVQAFRTATASHSVGER